MLGQSGGWIEELLQVAADRNKPVVVLTNGGSFESSVAAKNMPNGVANCRMRWCRAVMPCRPPFANAAVVDGRCNRLSWGGVTPLPGDDSRLWQTEIFGTKQMPLRFLG